MGLFSKRQSLSPEEAHDLTGNARLKPKEMKALKDKADGKVKRTGDLKAGVSDFVKGKKPKIPDPPPPRKGRSMW